MPFWRRRKDEGLDAEIRGHLEEAVSRAQGVSTRQAAEVFVRCAALTG